MAVPVHRQRIRDHTDRTRDLPRSPRKGRRFGDTRACSRSSANARLSPDGGTLYYADPPSGGSSDALDGRARVLTGSRRSIRALLCCWPACRDRLAAVDARQGCVATSHRRHHGDSPNEAGRPVPTDDIVTTKSASAGRHEHRVHHVGEHRPVGAMPWRCEGLRLAHQ